MSELLDAEEAVVSVPPLTLGWRMQMAMAHGGRSIEHMLIACGVGRSTVSRWIHDKGKRPRRGDLEIWARECRVPFSWLAPNPEEMDDFEQFTVPKVRSCLE
jgi:transcriptional regulator with XRE-family HTH domain